MLACAHWFVFRRFNLADPAVMSTLFPILEGGKTIRIPGTATDIVAAEGFRFFATQNDAM
jgi:midasin (ATPase involved in ribosome maturation)